MSYAEISLSRQIEMPTRWAKTIPLEGYGDLVVDNWGVLTLDGRRPTDGYAAPWEWQPSPVDAPPEVVFVPKPITAINYMKPAPLPIHIVPPDIADDGWTKVESCPLWSYTFGDLSIVAGYVSDLNTWWLCRRPV